MRLSFFWKKQLLDTLEVTEQPWVFVSISAPPRLVGAAPEVIATELRIVDEEGGRWAMDVEGTDTAFGALMGYVARAPAPCAAVAPAPPRAVDAAFSFGSHEVAAVARAA